MSADRYIPGQSSQQDGEPTPTHPIAPVPRIPELSVLRTIWEDPAKVIELAKAGLTERGEPIVEKLADGPLPVRLFHSVPLSSEQAGMLGFDEAGGTIFINRVRESMFRMHVFGDKTTGEEHVAVIKGDIGDGEDVPIRIHSSCLTAETFHASNCDCMEQLETSLQIADREGRGGVLWLHQEGRGNGLSAKAQQLTLMFEQGMNTVEAFEALGRPSEQRDFTAAAHMLDSLGIKSVRLITNNPEKIGQLKKLGIRINGKIPCKIPPLNDVVRNDLRAKRDKHGHDFDQDF